MIFGTSTFIALFLTSVGASTADFDSDIKPEVETIVDARISLLEDEFRNLYKEALKGDGNCFVEYEGRCFFAIIVGNLLVNREAARLSCESKNAKLANIYSSEHYDQLMPYLRPWIAAKQKGTGSFMLYTGMTFEPTTNVMKLSDGTQAAYFKWAENYPSSGASATAITLAVYQKGSAFNGMRNEPPSYARFGVICEIPITKNFD